MGLKATGRARRRLLINKLAELAALAAALAAIAVLVVLVWSVFSRGVHALNLDFFTKGPVLFGSGGGVAPALVGSLILVAGGVLLWSWLQWYKTPDAPVEPVGDAAKKPGAETPAPAGAAHGAAAAMPGP